MGCDFQSKSDKRDITSFVVELQTVWFNFAAPPHTPITKKIDYTRWDDIFTFLSSQPCITPLELSCLSWNKMHVYSFKMCVAYYLGMID